MIDNTAAYRDLEWILGESDSGFFLLVASSAMQEKIFAQYRDSDIRVYDYREHPDSNDFGQLLQWIGEAAEKTCIIQNMQLVLFTDEACSRLNLLRDALHRLNANIIFCMASFAEERLNRIALDFYSYVKLVIRFEDEGITERKPQTEIQSIDLSENIAPPEIDLNGDPQFWLSRAQALLNIAQGFLNAGRFRDAMTFLKAVQQIRERYLPENHADIADTYDVIAHTYYEIESFDEALSYCEKALAIREGNLGREHLDTAGSYNNIALIYAHMGKLDLALEYSKKALEISVEKLGNDHPNTATAYNNIAAICDSIGNLDLALAYNKKALAIYEAEFGINHPKTATIYNNLAFVYWERGDLKTAQTYFAIALSIRQRVLGKNHRYTKGTQLALDELKKEMQ